MRSLGWVRTVAVMGLLAAGLGLACAQERQRPLVAVSGISDLIHLQVRTAGGEVLWAIDTDEPTPLGGIYYGTVPAGYRQTTPAGGETPRPFVEHESLRILSYTQTRGFIHWATATGPAEISIYNSKTWLRSFEPEDFDVEEELENPPEHDPVFLFETEE